MKVLASFHLQAILNMENWEVCGNRLGLSWGLMLFRN